METIHIKTSLYHITGFFDAGILGATVTLYDKIPDFREVRTKTRIAECLRKIASELDEDEQE
jgi:hypothetical protein